MNTFIKNSIAVVIILCYSNYAFADGPTGISGKNVTGETVSGYEAANNADEPVITPSHPHFEHWDISISIDNNSEPIQFQRQYCGYRGDTYSSNWSFSCSADGKSPLAGVTYIFDKTVKLPKCVGYPFVCKSGCNARTPRLMIKPYWECSEDE